VPDNAVSLPGGKRKHHSYLFLPPPVVDSLFFPAVFFPGSGQTVGKRSSRSAAAFHPLFKVPSVFFVSSCSKVSDGFWTRAIFMKLGAMLCRGEGVFFAG